MGFISAHLGIQVGFVVFCDFAGDGGSLITANGVDLVAGNAVGLLASHCRALIAIDFCVLAAISFRHSTLHAFRLAATDGIGLVSCYHIRLISAYIGALVTVNRSCLAAVFFRDTTFDRFGFAAAHRILLVAAHDVGLVSAYRGLLVGLDVGLQGIEVFLFRTFHIHGTVSGHGVGLITCHIMVFISAHLGIQVGLVVFCDLAGNRFRQSSFYGIALVTGYFGTHITTNSRHQILANGIGHVICRSVGDVLGAVAQGFRSNVSNVLGIVCNTSILSCISDIFRSCIFDVFSSVGNSTVISCIGNISIGRCIGNVICCFIGNRIRCFIDQFLSFVSDSTLFCRIGNIRRSLGGRSRVGSIGDFTGDGIYLLIYLGEYRIRRFKLIQDFIDTLLERRGFTFLILEDTTGFRCTLSCCIGVTIFIRQCAL